MESICNLKSGKAIIGRMRRILSTPYGERRRKFGTGWPWDITNGSQEVRERFPECIPDMERMMQETGPKTADDLVAVSPGR